MNSAHSLLAATFGTAVLLAMSASSAFASPASGLWRTADGGRIDIYDCGAALCGKVVPDAGNSARLDVHNKAPALRGRPIAGLEIMTGFAGGPERWTGGKIYNPDDGNIYSGSIRMTSPTSLELTGCVVAPICKKQVWMRIK
jgi:uncharacterized protein (DUF2147 family)